MPTALAALVLLVASMSCSAAWTESADLGEQFRRAGVEGTFVVRDPRTGGMTGYNERRASTRFVPASTFKIANTLIGLTLGAVKSVDEILEYGGQPQPVEAWEQDMSLREAIVKSNVAIYQVLARRIGLARMVDGVALLDYGNKDIGHVVDRFWLDGPLRISAIEQTGFLAKLIARRLPVSETAQVQTQTILLREQGDGWALWAKSGWENFPNEGVGWWVGWVRAGGLDYPFALNMDMEGAEAGPVREALAKSCLQALGLLP
ncbi:MAG: class D beta-lactamase [Gammaproteobacteria bacterium]